ncbi:hypothetical protein [Phyllobacterium endophyticum]|uniref:hypothetical protein n=1 Tax=Phyllobacterium endophyticum TaxID=1149773 RepID=UPI0011C9B834|nr:hypothetical protein [Phyllobacterium endophyticum]TXR49228.1 hypothetical protein FVA77_11420 [Phyllobacterium endophyticum]
MNIISGLARMIRVHRRWLKENHAPLKVWLGRCGGKVSLAALLCAENVSVFLQLCEDCSKRKRAAEATRFVVGSES